MTRDGGKMTYDIPRDLACSCWVFLQGSEQVSEARLIGDLAYYVSRYMHVIVMLGNAKKFRS